MKMNLSRKQLLIPYALFVGVFVVVPLLFVVYFAFTNGSTGAFTLENFAKFLGNETSLSTLIISVLISAATTVVCLIIAYPIAYILAMSNWKKGNVLLMLFVLPMWINFVLRINALREFLDLLNLLDKNHYLNTIIGMVYDFLPFMILPLYTTLTNIDKSFLEASQDLGANKVTTFCKVTLPLSKPGIMSGITMVFMPTMTCYVISDTLGLGHVTIIGKLIEETFGIKSDWNLGSAIAIILLLIIMVSMLATGDFNSHAKGRGEGVW